MATDTMSGHIVPYHGMTWVRPWGLLEGPNLVLGAVEATFRFHVLVSPWTLRREKNSFSKFGCFYKRLHEPRSLWQLRPKKNGNRTPKPAALPKNRQAWAKDGQQAAADEAQTRQPNPTTGRRWPEAAKELS